MSYFFLLIIKYWRKNFPANKQNMPDYFTKQTDKHPKSIRFTRNPSVQLTKEPFKKFNRPIINLQISEILANIACKLYRYRKSQKHLLQNTMLQPFLDATKIEAGCDEAGRGCLAGPVFAAAVILPPTFKNDQLNDSKQLTEHQRYMLREVIEQEAVAWAVGTVSHEEIDKINILRASFLAMHRAIDQLSPVPEALLIDGNRFTPYPSIPHTCIVKGDGKYLSIAAASILAKTYRDDYMLQLHQEYPMYDWNNNKGYPTKKHREAIAQYGSSPYHRQTFQLLKKQYDLFE